MVSPTVNTDSTATEQSVEAPPAYGDLESTSSVPFVSNQSYNENEFGELDPTRADPAQWSRCPSDEVYAENEFGEIHRIETDPDNASEGSDLFGKDTRQKSVAYQSDETYSENRFGELGRADTFRVGEPHLADKIKGTAEQIVGKLTGNRDLYDKGIWRKANHHHHYSLGCHFTT